MNPAGISKGSATATHGKSGNPAKRNNHSLRGHNTVKPASVVDWISGARMRTLPLAIAPVALGTGAAIVASEPGVYHPVRALLALIVALCLQIGVNLSLIHI